MSFITTKTIPYSVNLFVCITGINRPHINDLNYRVLIHKSLFVFHVVGPFSAVAKGWDIGS